MIEPGNIDGVSDGMARHVADTFGLVRFEQAGCTLESVASSGAGLRISFNWKGVGNAVVEVAPDDGQPAYARASKIVFRLVGGEVSRPWAILMTRMAISARDFSPGDLADLAAAPPDAGVPSSSGTVGQEPYNPVLQWGRDDGWRHFVCDAAMERRFREAFEFDPDSSFIVHGDLECRFVSPGARIRLPGYFVYPFDLFSHTESVGPVTDLNDLDVITDPSIKIESRVLREAKDGKIRGPVVVLSTCVPIVIAEDPGPVLKRLASVCPSGISYVTPASPLSPSEMFMESFVPLRREVLQSPPEPSTVGLVGYRPGRGLDGLAGLLGSVGLAVKGAIVPLVTRRLLTGVLSSETIVIAPGRYHDEIFNRLVEGAADAGRRVIKPEFPWGPAATVRWLADVAGPDGGPDAQCDFAVRGETATRARIDRIRPTAAFLFVTDIEGLGRLFDPLSPAGLPLLPVMCDLGLKSRVLVFCAPGGEAAAEGRLRALAASLKGADRIEFEPFYDEPGLAGSMRAPDAGAVYSEMFFDYRATQNGLQVFSSRIFEPGFDGAVRTVARFRRLAGLPFYRRYLSATQARDTDSLV